MDKKITFSRLVKEELVSDVTMSHERLLALLSAYIRINGVLSFSNKKIDVYLKSENAKIIKFIYKGLKDNFLTSNISLNYSKKSNNKRKTNYIIEIIDAENLLNELSVNYIEGKISKEKSKRTL